MVVLLLFNDAEQLSYREIAEATEIPALELKRSLQSLACAKGETRLQAPCTPMLLSSKCVRKFECL
jgi:cullin 3